MIVRNAGPSLRWRLPLAAVLLIGCGAVGWWAAGLDCHGEDHLDRRLGFVLGATSLLPLALQFNLLRASAGQPARFAGEFLANGYLFGVIFVLNEPLVGDCDPGFGSPLVFLLWAGIAGFAMASFDTFQRWANQPPGDTSGAED